MPIWIKWLWASPYTLFGLVLAMSAAIFGGRISMRDGAIEVTGPGIAFLLGRLPFPVGGAAAMTLGHVVLAQSASDLERTRRHERVHVAQYEVWGPFFLPAYAASSILQRLKGGDPYRDNFFERQAYQADSE